MRRTLPLIAVVSLLIIVAVIAATPAFANGPDHHTLYTQEVNMKKPHKGAFSDVITEAAKVPKKWRPFASCVLDRESGGSLDKVQSGVRAKNPRSSASGRWQFLNNSWNRPLAFMVAAELKEEGLPKPVAKEIRVKLQKKPIHKWHGYFQDIGFVAVVTEGGWYHWRGAYCNGKRP